MSFGTAFGADDMSPDLLTPSDVPPPFAADFAVPSHLDALPDDSRSLVIGDINRLTEFNHRQGDNPYGFQQDCGLVSCQDVLNQFGIAVTETDVITHAVTNGLCQVADNPSDSGGTTAHGQAEILNDFGIPAHVEQNQSLEELAGNIQNGCAVITQANAGVLWNDAAYYDNGDPNHAVTVTGVARDPGTGEIRGFYINDSGTGNSAQFVSAEAMRVGWLDTGGQSVVTDVVRGNSPQLGS